MFYLNHKPERQFDLIESFEYKGWTVHIAPVERGYTATMYKGDDLNQLQAADDVQAKSQAKEWIDGN